MVLALGWSAPGDGTAEVVDIALPAAAQSCAVAAPGRESMNGGERASLERA
jgi:hypothetical protein